MLGSDMNRAGFFKAIGGAIAATVGVKFVPKAWTSEPFRCVDLVFKKSAAVNSGKTAMAMCPRLRAAIDEETKNINAVTEKFIEEGNDYLNKRIPSGERIL